MQPPENPYGPPNPAGPSGPYGQPNPAPPYGAPPGAPPGYQPGGYQPGMPPGYRPGGPMGAPAPRGTVSLDVIGEAWRMVSANLGIWVLAILMVFAISWAISFVGTLATLPLAPHRGESASGAYTAVRIVLQIISFVVSSFLGAGLTRMAINNIRTGAPDISQVFSVSDVFGGVMLASILVALCTGIGFVLLIIPGVIAALGLSMTQQLVVDRKLSAVDAMKTSWEAMKPHLGSMFVLGLVLGLINIAGVLACCVGALVTASITQLALALVYRDLFGLGGAPQPGMGAGFPPGGGYAGGGQYPGYQQPPIPRP